ncbi:MAG TPA: hypothetical protein VGV40_06750 [Solirubrobacteraceae bacterium]|nr:hypothetical protein [Solirubrobacteraceae bacterium]
MRAPVLPALRLRGSDLREHALPLAVAAVCALTVAVGWTARALGVVWGTPRQPFLGTFGMQVSPWAIPGAIVLALCAWQAVRIARPAATGPRAFMVWTLGLALASRLAVNVARIGPHGWTDMYSIAPEASNEYLPALPALEGGLGLLLDRFAEWLPALPVHSAGHPPGLLITMDVLGVDTAGGLAALIIGVGVISAPLVYALGRELSGEGPARLATVLWIFAPSALLYGASAADALFATLGLLGATVVVLSPSRGSLVRRLALPLGAGLLAVASFFAWSLLGMAAWAVFLVALRDGLRRGVVAGAVIAAALVALYAALWALTGFEVVEVLRRTEEVYRFSVASVRPYAFWLFGSPAAFLIGCGLPVLWFAARALQRRDRGALALAGVIVIASVAGFTKAETERIWLSFLPLACLAAATSLPPRWLVPAVAIMAVQAFLVQVLLYTVW